TRAFVTRMSHAPEVMTMRTFPLVAFTLVVVAATASYACSSDGDDTGGTDTGDSGAQGGSDSGTTTGSDSSTSGGDTGTTTQTDGGGRDGGVRDSAVSGDGGLLSPCTMVGNPGDCIAPYQCVSFKNRGTF